MDHGQRNVPHRRIGGTPTGGGIRFRRTICDDNSVLLAGFGISFSLRLEGRRYEPGQSPVAGFSPQSDVTDHDWIRRPESRRAAQRHRRQCLTGPPPTIDQLPDAVIVGLDNVVDKAWCTPRHGRIQRMTTSPDDPADRRRPLPPHPRRLPPLLGRQARQCSRPNGRPRIGGCPPGSRLISPTTPCTGCKPRAPDIPATVEHRCPRRTSRYLVHVGCRFCHCPRVPHLHRQLRAHVDIPAHNPKCLRPCRRRRHRRARATSRGQQPAHSQTAKRLGANPGRWPVSTAEPVCAGGTADSLVIAVDSARRCRAPAVQRADAVVARSLAAVMVRSGDAHRSPHSPTPWSTAN